MKQETLTVGIVQSYILLVLNSIGCAKANDRHTLNKEVLPIFVDLFVAIFKEKIHAIYALDEGDVFTSTDVHSTFDTLKEWTLRNREKMGIAILRQETLSSLADSTSG